jgi:cytoskeletal protein CcmA (bactofilin family)
MRRIISLAVLVLLALATFRSVNAFDGRTGDIVTIPAGEVIEDDLYITAGTFVLGGTVKGDLIVLGGEITIEPGGVVEQDLMAAGQTVTISGQVMDDARIAGAALVVDENAQIGGDLLGSGYSLETRQGSTVGGDLIFAGGQALLAGTVDQDVYAAVGGLELRGTVQGNVNASVGSPGQNPVFPPTVFMPGMPEIPSVPSGLRVAEGAQIGGNLEYTTQADAAIPAGAVAGQVVRQEPAVQEEQPRNVVLDWFLDNLRNLASLLVVGLLLAWLAPGFIARTSAALREQPLPSLLWGIVSFFAVFFALFVLAVIVVILAIFFGFITLGSLVGTIIGLGLLAAFALILGFIIAVSYLSKIVVSYLGGRLILTRLSPQLADSRVWPMILGIVLFAILAAIPILGWLVSLVVVLLGLGALWLWAARAVRREPLPAAGID